LLLVAAICYFLVQYPLEAAAPVKIKINGRERDLSPPCQVRDGRLMVPLRFVVEDEALQSQVAWDAARQQATVYCREQRFDFYAGNRTARLNGQAVQLDVEPYIFARRMFIPVRFFSRWTGATVGWKDRDRTAILNFTPRPRVLAYYYGDGFAELQQRAHLLTDVVFRWYQTDEQGRVFYEYSDTYYEHKFDEALSLARQAGLKTHAGVMLMDRQKLTVLLSSPLNRQALVENVKKMVIRQGYDGVNIDFEFIAPEERDNFTRLVQELKTALGPDKTVSVAVFARTGLEKWPTAYDYQALGRVCDMVVIMAYDYHYEAAGALAPIDWCQQVLEYAEKNIPREKILMGIGTYGYDWEGKSRKSVYQSQLDRLKAQFQAEEGFDRQACSPCLVYQDQDGHRHEVWYENRASLEEKWALYLEHGIAGISYWKLGGAFTDFYAMLESSRQ